MSSRGHWADWAALSVRPRSSIEGRTWTAVRIVARSRERTAMAIFFFHWPAVKKACPAARKSVIRMNSGAPARIIRAQRNVRGTIRARPGRAVTVEEPKDPGHPGQGRDVVIELKRREIHAAQSEKRRPQERSLPRKGIGPAEDVQAEPPEEGVDEIMELEGREQGEEEIEPGRRIEDRVLRIGQERLAVAVGVRPQGEVPFFKQLNGEFPDRNLDDGRIPFIKDPVCEKEFSEDEKEKDNEEGKEEKILLRNKAGRVSTRDMNTISIKKRAFSQIFDFSTAISLYLGKLQVRERTGEGHGRGQETKRDLSLRPGSLSWPSCPSS